MTYNNDNRHINNDYFLNNDITRGLAKKRSKVKTVLFMSTLFVIVVLTSFYNLVGIKAQQVIPAPNNKTTNFYDVQLSDVTNPIYDGDTVRVNIEGLHSLLGSDIPIRIAGIDTPELKSEKLCERRLAMAARNFTHVQLSVAEKIDLRNCKRGKYFRLVCSVLYDGKDIGKQLLNRKLAVRYEGGAKKPWCDS